MAETKINQTLNDTFKEFQQEVFENLNCIKIGRIISFNAKKKTAVVSINFVNYSGNDGYLYKNDCDDLEPYIQELPVIGNCFHQPILEGMSVLCLFNDKNIDKWFHNETTFEPINNRKHDVSDGFVLCGLDNLINNSFEQPSWWEPPKDLPEICDCPINKYGYDNDHARMRCDAGDVSCGWDGVTICGRDYAPVKIYAEGSSIYMFPTEEVIMDNSYGHFMFLGPESVIGEYDRIAGKFALYNENYTKPNSVPGEPPFILSDMYRLLKQAKKCLQDIIKALYTHDDALEDIAAEQIDIAVGSVNDLILRIDGLFTPGDGLIPTEDDEE